MTCEIFRPVLVTSQLSVSVKMLETTKKRRVAPPGQALDAYPSDATRREVPRIVDLRAPQNFNSATRRKFLSVGMIKGVSSRARHLFYSYMPLPRRSSFHFVSGSWHGYHRHGKPYGEVRRHAYYNGRRRISQRKLCLTSSPLRGAVGLVEFLFERLGVSVRENPEDLVARG